MAKKFFIRSKQSKGIAPLYVEIRKRTPKVRFMVCTSVDVDIATWQRVNRTPKVWLDYIATEEGKRINTKLELIEGAIEQLFANGEIQSNEDKGKIDNAIATIIYHEINDIKETERKRKAEREAAERNNIISFYDYYMAGLKQGTILKRGKNYSAGSIRMWGLFGSYLKGYCPPRATFADITKSFADKFVVYLQRLGLMQMTINTHVGFFRRLCNYAAEEGVNTNAVSLKVWKMGEVLSELQRRELYLTEAELNALYAMPLSGRKAEIRDVFFLGYLSCQRFSDYSDFQASNFKTTDNGIDIICLTQKKTGAYIEVPITDKRVKAICTKYGYNFPRVGEVTMNTKIKGILHLLATNVPSLKEMFATNLTKPERAKESKYQALCAKEERGEAMARSERASYLLMRKYAKEVDGSPLYHRDHRGNVMRPKWELVSSHTARRSGVTNMYKQGLLNTREMMSITGHKTEDVFAHYIKLGTTEQAERIAAKIAAAEASENSQDKGKEVAV